MKGLGTTIIVSALCFGVITGCGANDEARTYHKTMPGDDRYMVREYNTHRAYTFDHTKNTSLPLELRLANEAERVYNVREAVAVRQGNDILMGIVRHTHPLYPEQEVLSMVRERLENQEPEVAGYNLYIFEDPNLQEKLTRIKTNQENKDTPGFMINATEPTFDELLREYKQTKETKTR